jgi:hypothetical protein
MHKSSFVRSGYICSVGTDHMTARHQGIIVWKPDMHARAKSPLIPSEPSPKRSQSNSRGVNVIRLAPGRAVCLASPLMMGTATDSVWLSKCFFGLLPGLKLIPDQFHFCLATCDERHNHSMSCANRLLLLLLVSS